MASCLTLALLGTLTPILLASKTSPCEGEKKVRGGQVSPGLDKIPLVLDCRQSCPCGHNLRENVQRQRA